MKGVGFWTVYGMYLILGLLIVNDTWLDSQRIDRMERLPASTDRLLSANQALMDYATCKESNEPGSCLVYLEDLFGCLEEIESEEGE